MTRTVHRASDAPPEFLAKLDKVIEATKARMRVDPRIEPMARWMWKPGIPDDEWADYCETFPSKADEYRQAAVELLAVADAAAREQER